MTKIKYSLLCQLYLKKSIKNQFFSKFFLILEYSIALV